MRSSQALVAQHDVHLCLAHSLQLFDARVAAEASIAAQAQRFTEQALHLPDIARHAVAPRRRADDVVQALLLRHALLRQIAHEQLIRFGKADAVITAEAALLKGHELGLNLVLHIAAHALDICANNGSYRGSHHEDDLRCIIFIQLHQRLLQTRHVTHDHIVLAHMRSEEAVLKAQAKAAI